MGSTALGGVTIGPQSWQEDTMRSIQQAKSLVLQTQAGHTRPLSVAVSSSKITDMTADVCFGKHISHNSVCTHKIRPQTTGTMFSQSNKTRVGAPFPPPSLREQCAQTSAGVTLDYMRSVREVEGQLRRQAGRVTQEGTKLEREKGHLEKLHRSLRCDIHVNQKSVEGRTRRTATAETVRDGADELLVRERRELTELKGKLESTLRSALTQLQTLGQCSRHLLECAAERTRVLELLPHSGSLSAAVHGSQSQALAPPDPIGPFTPGCKQALEFAILAVSQSQLLRETIRQVVGNAIARQKAAHHTVNDSLVKKIAETVALKQRLTLTSAATRQAMFRKQRQIVCIGHSHDRAMGPVYSGDILSREKINRPLVRVYQRHPGTQLLEAAHLIQGSAVLRQCLQSTEGELAKLQGTCLQLLDNLRGKRAAAQVDAAVVRMRRQCVDKRSMPTFLQQGSH